MWDVRISSLFNLSILIIRVAATWLEDGEAAWRGLFLGLPFPVLRSRYLHNSI